jgi:hypothetical protein
VNPFRDPLRNPLKDQRMKIVHSSVLAFASMFVLSLNLARATTLVEIFSNDPLAQGWLATGHTSLFRWNDTNQNLEVTWDSSKANSYFCRPFGAILTKASDFMLGFDLRLNDIAGGVNPGKPFPFQISIGLLHLAQATNAGFIRGSGFQAPNLVEFDYFPAAVFDPTVSPVLISSNNEFSAGGFTFPLELTTNTVFQVTMIYTAEDRTLRTQMTGKGMPFGLVKDATLGTSFSDFTVDHFGVSSYSDVGQFPGFEGSVLAHGVVDNFMLAAPPPVTRVTAINEAGAVRLQFLSTTNWVYTLERTTSFQSWDTASSAVAGTGGMLTLQDTNPPMANAFYRVKARFP